MRRPEPTNLPTDASAQRLDVWLWHARIARTRNACTALAKNGRIRINRMATDKAHARVRVGDVLTIPGHPAPNVRVLKILSLEPRRGAAETTIRIYEDLS